MSSTQKVLDHSLIGISWTADMVDACRTMAKRRIGALGVYTADGKDLIGVVSERDAMQALAAGKDPGHTKVREIMSSPLLRVEGPITRRGAQTLMRESDVRHLIVRNGGADRIVSLRDV